MPIVEDIVIIDSNDYAQVIFDDVKECFIENQPLECHFNLNDLLRADSSDMIGVYKVGFVNYKDYYCCVTVDLSLISENKGKITFPGIYQLSYLFIHH